MDVDSTPQETGSETRTVRGPECPKCHSDDVKRSRRKIWERLVLPLLSAQVSRCRDCKHRFWVGAKWARLVYASIVAAFFGGVATTVVLVWQSRELPAQPAAPATRRSRFVRSQLPPPPRGLPPLSKVPRPKDDAPPAKSANPQ